MPKQTPPARSSNKPAEATPPPPASEELRTPPTTTTNAGTGTVDETDPLNAALAYKQRYESLLTQARDTTLSDINTRIERLNSIGAGHYRLIEVNNAVGGRGPGRPAASGGAGKRDWKRPPRQFNPAKHCDVCGIAGHDKRAHRGQVPNVRAFTQDELATLNYLPPAGAPATI
jgi:hypothetical protein